jgi:hypothetical protein
VATELEIANQALLLLGEGLITSGQLATPDDAKSRLVANLLTMSRKAALRDCKPNCARAYADLTTAGVQVHPDHAYTFVLPTDCLRVLTVFPGLSTDVSRLTQGRQVVTRWRIVTGSEIALDEPQACVEYVKNIATTAFDPMMDDAMAHYLAWKMAVPLTESRTKRTEMAQAYAAARELLRQTDEQEGITDQFDDATRLQTARHGSNYGAW